jgi:hypothetical protein
LGIKIYVKIIFSSASCQPQITLQLPSYYFQGQSGKQALPVSSQGIAALFLEGGSEAYSFRMSRSFSSEFASKN